jgi:HK97 family phage prohead protease
VKRAREILALLRDGAVDGLSIGFRVEQARPERPTGLRRLDRLDLWEISLVTFPMLPAARVSSVKRAAPDAGLAERIRAAAGRLFP